MPILIDAPTRVAAAGEPPKRIDEYIGRVRSGTDSVSVAHMRSPSGWMEPGQRPEWVRYSTPGPAGAEYVAVCVPAFTLDAANRDE